MNRVVAVRLLVLAALAWVVFVPWLAPGHAQGPPPFDKLLEELVPRPLGPANMGGRVVDVAIVERKPALMYVATASGGLWKTTNNGTTWMPVFDRAATVALGAVAVARSSPDIVWVGTGEANPRNSVSWGDGLYKSSDGGHTWNHRGLMDSAHIGRIVIHPANPDVVYVAALGKLWGPSLERGLFRTSDGGQTWQKILFINEDTGCIDVAMNPGNPDVLYAAMYQVRRGPFSGGNPAVETGLGAGLFKTTDAGRTWKRLTRGLPARSLGRCGLAVSHQDPRIVCAVVQTDKTAAITPGQLPQSGNDSATGGVFRSDDGGETWTKLNDLCPRPFYFGQIRIDPNDSRRIYVLGLPLFVSPDGGRQFASVETKGVHSDHHALWIDPRDSDHLVLGGDGGLYISYDRGLNWEHINNLPIGQFYQVAVDMRQPYRVYGGLQDNGSWGGPSATRRPEGITNADWARFLGADGFYCQVDPANADFLYAEGQYGALRRINLRTGDVADIRPHAAAKAPAYRFNWDAPVLLSPHQPHTLFFGGNHLFRSTSQGERWEVISPDLTRGRPGASPDFGHTITAIAESPLRHGLLYVGTDDGRVHVSRNGGTNWTDIGGNIPNLPPDRWVNRIECSSFGEGVAYLAIDRHRQNDCTPYLYRTVDYGATWTSLANDLPAGGPVHVIRTDPRSGELLFAGTEFGLFISVDGGRHWHPIRQGLPTVAVHDLAIQPRDHDLIIATHGRSLYVLDIGPLEELTPRVLQADDYLFDIKPAILFRYRGSRGGGSKPYAAPNPPFGALIHYYLKTTAARTIQITINDTLGRLVADMSGNKEAGLHQLNWNLRHMAASHANQPGALVPAGEYVVRLRVGDRIWSRTLRVEAEE